MEGKNGETAQELKSRLKNAICGKLAEIRGIVAAEAKSAEAAGGKDALESVMCAVDCTVDQVRDAFADWTAPSGENAQIETA